MLLPLVDGKYMPPHASISASSRLSKMRGNARTGNAMTLERLQLRLACGESSPRAQRYWGVPTPYGSVLLRAVSDQRLPLEMICVIQLPDFVEFQHDLNSNANKKVGQNPAPHR
jgi:hypothetical protein